MDVLLAALSAAMWGSADFMGGMASRRNLPLAITWSSQIVGLVSIVIAALIVPASSVSATDYWWGAAAGSAGALGLLLLYSALATGPMTVVAPVTAVCAAVVPVAAGLLDGDRPKPAALVGILFAFPAIVMVAGGGGEAPEAVVHRERAQPRVVAQSLGSGVMFGLFFVLIDRAGADSGMWPLVGARLGSVTLLTLAMAGFAAGRRRSREPLGLSIERTSWWFILGAGVLDVAANAAFLLRGPGRAVSVVSVVSSMYPAATVLLAWVVLRERLSQSQKAGLVLATLAVGLVAYGR